MTREEDEREGCRAVEKKPVLSLLIMLMLKWKLMLG